MTVYDIEVFIELSDRYAIIDFVEYLELDFT
jgi:hypothetical protein